MNRRLPAEQRRAQLLDSALEMAEQNGLESVTVRGVADRAGVSLGVVHYCFTDKDELLREVVRTVNADIAAAADAFLSVDFGGAAHGRESLRELLREALDLMWTVISGQPERQLLTYEIVTHSIRTDDPTGKHLAAGQYEGYDQIVATILDRTAESAAVRWTVPTEHRVRLVMNLIDGTALRWQLDRDDAQAIAALHLGVDLLVGIVEPLP